MMARILKITVYFLYRFLSFCKFFFCICFWSIRNRTSPFFWEVQKKTKIVKKFYKRRNHYMIWNVFMVLLSFFGFWAGFFIDFLCYTFCLMKNSLQIFLEKVELLINNVQKNKKFLRLRFYRYFLKKVVFFYGWLELSIPVYLFIPLEKWVVSVSNMIPFLLNQNQSQIRLSDWEVETYFSRPIQIFFRNLTERWISFFRLGREKKMSQFQSVVVHLPVHDLFLEKLVCLVKESLLNKAGSRFFVKRRNKWSNFFLESKMDPFEIKSILVEESHRKIVFCWRWLSFDYSLKQRFQSWLDFIEEVQDWNNNKRLKWLEKFLANVVFLFKVLDIPFRLINKFVFSVFLFIFRWFLVLIEILKFKK